MASNQYRSGDARISIPQEHTTPPGQDDERPKLLPQHFLARPGTTKHTATGTVTSPGPLVPLIPIDQLPEWIDVVGVPRELTAEQTVGICNLGSIPKSPEFYQVRLHKDVRVAAEPRYNEHYRNEGDTTSRTNGDGQYLSARRLRTAGSSGSRMDPGARVFTSIKKHISTTKSEDNLRYGSKHTGLHPQDSDSSTSSPSSSSKAPSSSSTVNTSVPKQSPNNSGNTDNKKGTVIVSSSAVGGGSNNTHANQKPPTVVVPLNARMPSPPPPSNKPANPYPLAHPASRLLSSFAPGVVQQSRSRSNRNPGGSEGVYCRHWCLHGTCKWGGLCRFLHEMPTTAEGLQEVGLLAPPAWWVQAALAGRGGHGGWYGGRAATGGRAREMRANLEQGILLGIRERFEQVMMGFSNGGGVGIGVGVEERRGGGEEQQQGRRSKKKGAVVSGAERGRGGDDENGVDQRGDTEAGRDLIETDGSEPEPKDIGEKGVEKTKIEEKSVAEPEKLVDV